MRSLASIAAIVIAVGGCAGAGTASGPAVASTAPLASSSISTVSASPGASVDAPTAIPDALRYVWIGPARDIAALGGPQPLSIIRFRGTAARFDYIFGARGQESLHSTVDVPAPGQVRFTATNTTGCRVGEEGIYGWKTAADGATLALTKVTEECSPRAEAVVGDWVRAACHDFGCLGDLEAGTHVTAFLEPLGQHDAFGSTWRMQYGQLSYTVPAGWANAVDDPNLYNLVPQDEYAKVVNDVTRHPGIVLIPDVAIAAQDAACSPEGEPGIGQDSAKMAARVAQIPGLEVGAATSIRISGRSGTRIDVALKPGWKGACAVDGGVPVLRQGGDGTAGSDWRMNDTARWRLVLLDVAKGHPMAILIDSFDEPTRFDGLVSQAMPIVRSFELHLPAA